VEHSTDEREEEDQTQVLDESGSHTTVVHDYKLARDRDRRIITPLNRYSYVDLICYALNAGEEVQETKPKNIREAKQGLAEGNE
jgi:hypothetical protein